MEMKGGPGTDSAVRLRKTQKINISDCFCTQNEDISNAFVVLFLNLNMTFFNFPLESKKMFNFKKVLFHFI